MALSSTDCHLWNEGTWHRAWEKLGARPDVVDHVHGYRFAVWAPNAAHVALVGQFNNWQGAAHPMHPVESSGIWALFVPHLTEGQTYKFEIHARSGDVVLKADPFGLQSEHPPQTASITSRLDGYDWRDDRWMQDRPTQGARLDRPMAIYEVHPGSWRRAPDDGHRALTWRELARDLIPYVVEHGFTHIELLPVMEHPYEPSWGYQVTGYFAPTSRFGTPDDLRFFVDECHRAGVAVLLDWVPGHFPKDAHGLRRFDGTALFEHEDPRQGEHQDWGTLIFNYGRHEVRNFLITNALYWLESFHVDGLRVDAVASMLYLDYSRDEGQWVPNQYGGRENLDAIDFLRELNTVARGEQPGAVIIAEESTAFPAVSGSTELGGLGFTYKWNMGWMHDILTYAGKDPLYRRWEHRHLTFSMLYAFSERFILPFSHDEVVHGKGSMLNKMAGDAWQKAANLRALYAFMYAHPGKKLMFMGSEFGQWREWSHERSLDWHLLEPSPGGAHDPNYHAGIQQFVTDLNRVYAREAALHEVDYASAGFTWIDCNDSERSVVSLIRSATDPDNRVIAIVNWTPVIREGYRLGVPESGYYEELLNSDASAYGGSNIGNNGGIDSELIEAHGYAQSLTLTLPPLGAIYLKRAAR